MSRKGHLSTKVANVKLRPAPAQLMLVNPSLDNVNSRDKQTDSELFAGDEDTSFNDRDPLVDAKPLSHIVVSMTGIQLSRNELTEKAKSLGARVELALTTDTTHLIAETVTTPKYKCAISYGKAVVLPSFINDMHDIWVSGGTDIDVKEFTNKHRVPTLHGLRIAITDYVLNPVSIRAEVTDSIQAAGGTYNATFSKRCTHLLIGSECKTSEQYEKNVKVKAARDMQKVYQDNACLVVWSEWLDDSLKMGGALQEDDYLAEKVPRPPPGRSVQAASQSDPDAKQPSSSILRKETYIEGPLLTNLDISMAGASTSTPARGPSVGTLTVPIKRGTEEEEDGSVVMRKKAKLDRTKSEMRINSLLGITVAQETTKSTTSRLLEDEDIPTFAKAQPTIQISDTNADSKLNPKTNPYAEAGPSRITVENSRKASFAKVAEPRSTKPRPVFHLSQPNLTVSIDIDEPPSVALDGQQSLELAVESKPAEDSGFGFPQAQELSDHRPDDLTLTPVCDPDEEETQDSIHPIFRGVRLYFTGYNQRDQPVPQAVLNATRACQDRGAVVYTDEDRPTDADSVDWVVVPLCNPKCSFDPNHAKVVADAWIEQCIHRNTYFRDPSEVPFSAPIFFGKIADGQSHCITTSGADACSAYIIKRLCIQAGLSFTDEWRSSVTHVVSMMADKSGETSRRAKAANKPIMLLDEFISCLEQAKPLESDSLPVEDLPLSGMRIFLTKKIAENVVCRSRVFRLETHVPKAVKKRLQQIMQSLGAQQALGLSSDTTHVVHVANKANKIPADVKQAKSDGKHVVHSEWLEACFKARALVSERAYPNTYLPSRALDYMTVSTKSNSQNSMTSLSDVKENIVEEQRKVTRSPSPHRPALQSVDRLRASPRSVNMLRASSAPQALAEKSPSRPLDKAQSEAVLQASFSEEEQMPTFTEATNPLEAETMITRLSRLIGPAMSSEEAAGKTSRRRRVIANKQNPEPPPARIPTDLFANVDLSRSETDPESICQREESMRIVVVDPNVLAARAKLLGQPIPQLGRPSLAQLIQDERAQTRAQFRST